MSKGFNIVNFGGVFHYVAGCTNCDSEAESKGSSRFSKQRFYNQCQVVSFICIHDLVKLSNFLEIPSSPENY